MIKIENEDVMGWEAAIRGMRNPMNSWEKSDSRYCDGRCNLCKACTDASDYESDNAHPHYNIGPNDHDLMMKLRNAGTDHRKFMRMITVYVDITAPLYWWKEFDTYKVGTVANSCSTMHKIHDKEFTLEDFSHEHLDDIWGYDPDTNTNYMISPDIVLNLTIGMLNRCRDLYLETKDKKYWRQMIQLLPSSYNQKRTVLLNYEVLANMYKSRKNHKLDEWHVMCDWTKSLPYSELITEDKESV